MQVSPKEQLRFQDKLTDFKQKPRAEDFNILMTPLMMQVPKKLDDGS
jgi:hypothetical protein